MQADHMLPWTRVIESLSVRWFSGSRQKHEQSYVLDDRILTAHNLIYVTRGRAAWVFDDTQYPLAAGDLLIVPPGVWHHAHSITRRITLGSTHITANLPGGGDALDALNPPTTRHVKHGSYLDGYLRGMMAEYDRPDQSPELRWQQARRVAQWSQLIVPQMLNDDLAAGRLTLPAIDPMVGQIMRLIEQRLSKPVSAAELADTSGYSRQHLGRLFRKVLGITPMQYQQHLRLERAQQLLREGTLTVAAVAHALGYDDPYFFSRQFKKHIGLSPTDWQRAYGSESLSP